MGDKKLRSDIVNLRVVAILAVIFGHSTTIYWYNWTDYRTTQEAPVFAHVGNLAMLVLGLWMLISGFCVGFTLRGKKRFKDFFIKRGLSLFGVGEWVGGGGGAGRVVWGYGYHVVVHRRPATA